MRMVNLADGFEIWTEKSTSSSMVTRRGYTCRVVSMRDRGVSAGGTNRQRHAKQTICVESVRMETISDVENKALAGLSALMSVKITQQIIWRRGGGGQPIFCWMTTVCQAPYLTTHNLHRNVRSMSHSYGDKKGGSEADTTFTESQISALSNALAGARYPVSSIQERGIRRTELVMPAQLNGEHLS